MGFDFAIVGGGTAGCVLAARLSEDPACRVLLVEAGPDYADIGALPPDVADACGPTLAHDWGYAADPELDRGMALPRARLIGGCSATNACFALRGAPADYDSWAARGNAGWSFDEVLPYFCRLEHDMDFDDPWHGTDGPIPIRRPPRDEWNPAQAAFLEGAIAAGNPYIDDHNRPEAVGAGPTPRNVRGGLRMSTALTYLAEARGRKNLTIRPDTLTARVEVVGGAATGIRVAGDEAIATDRVILAAGTYATPALLARSGIGPTGQLAALGIDVVAPLAGVGARLVDHPLVSVDLPVRSSGPTTRYQTTVSFHSSNADRSGPPDLQLFGAGPFDAEAADGDAVFAIVAGVMAPRSEGWVRLRSTDPEEPPQIHLGHLADRGDLVRMVEAVVAARRVARSKAMAGVVVGPEISPGRAISDADALSEWIRTHVSTYHHPVGTCAMGSDPEAGAVVDTRGAVHGVENLFVADASIMPVIPTANTHLPTIMVAERVAARLRAS